MIGRVLVLAVALAGVSCRTMAENIVAHGKAARMLPRFANCPDGQPVRLLLDGRCPGGVCGYSCLPRRWDVNAVCQPVTVE